MMRLISSRSCVEGTSVRAPASACGEVCFNTSMTGYQEILTDPSYKGQIVAMTYPLIGNYGVNQQDVESWRPHVAGFVIRELSPVVSNWRAEHALRPAVITRKTCGGGNRTVRGAQTQQVLTSVLRTAHQRGLDATTVLVTALRAPKPTVLDAFQPTSVH